MVNEAVFVTSILVLLKTLYCFVCEFFTCYFYILFIKIQVNFVIPLFPIIPQRREINNAEDTFMNFYLSKIRGPWGPLGTTGQ